MANGSPETRLGKNRVSTARNPVGKKPGFDGWGKNRVSTVGKKPGFVRLGKKPGFDGWEKTGFQWGQKPGWEKTGFRQLGKKPGFFYRFVRPAETWFL
jgi:hypothetical protein